MPHKGRAAWRDKGAVRVIALFDMILGLFLLCFYLIGGLMMNTVVFQATNGPLPKVALVIISLILWALVIGITGAQIFVGYRLFIVTFQDALGPKTQVQRALEWMRTSCVVFGLIIIKMIYARFRVPSPSVILWVVILIEILFKLLGVYYIREFCDDLKHHIKLQAKRPSIFAKSDITPTSIVVVP